MAATSALTRDKLFEIAGTLPAEPRVLVSLGSLLQDSNVGLDEVADLIKSDAAIAARIIRMSNSVVYGGKGGLRIGAIDEAVNRVGFSEVHRLVGMITGDRLSDRTLKFYGLVPETMRDHMMFTALAAEILAEECGFDPRNAYTTGLLRPLGMLILDRVAEHLTACEPYDHVKYGAYLAWEGIMFGLANSEVAYMVLTSWSFPSDVINAIREHYLTRSTDFDNKLAVILNLAGQIVADAGHTLPGDRRYWGLTPRKLDALGCNEETFHRASARAGSMFEQRRGHYSLSAHAHSPDLQDTNWPVPGWPNEVRHGQAPKASSGPNPQ